VTPARRALIVDNTTFFGAGMVNALAAASK
jgi:hypothetical protein